MVTGMTPDPPALSSSPLESLPAELRDRILLSMPDLPTLYSMVRASPVMHAQYRSNRDKLLRACLEHELDGFLVHAHACQMSRVEHLGDGRAHEVTTDFIDAYSQWLPSGSRPYADLGSVAPSDCRWMAAFHLTVARPLARLYSRWALENLRLAAGLTVAEEQDPETAAEPTATITAAVTYEDANAYNLSRSEEIRIMQALYQCETYHHLIGYPRRVGGNILAEYLVCDTFFSLFDPWEAEAMGCVHLFFRQGFDALFDKLRLKLQTAYPESNGQRIPLEGTPKGCPGRAREKVFAY